MTNPAPNTDAPSAGTGTPNPTPNLPATTTDRRDLETLPPSDGALKQWSTYGGLPVPARSQVDRDRAVRHTADLVGSVFPSLNRASHVALARWCIARDIDPITELDDVGGPYPNAKYYKRKLGELSREGGPVERWTQDQIGLDERLLHLSKAGEDVPEEERAWALREHYRRLRLRIKYAVPEPAAAACVTLIWLRGNPEPVYGVKWGGNGTSVVQPRRGGGGAGDPNPVVENNPELSVESQSIKRAVEKLAVEFPGMFDDPAQDEGLREIRAEIRSERKAAGQSTFNGAPKHQAPVLIAAAAPVQDTYGLGADADLARGEPVPIERAIANASEQILENARRDERVRAATARVSGVDDQATDDQADLEIG